MKTINKLWADAVQYTEHEAGEWLSTEGIFTPPSKVHALRLKTGAEWDVVNGLRGIPTRSTPSEPVYLLEGEIGHDVATPATSIGVELTPEHLAQLTAGKTVRMHASPNLVIQITVFGGAVDAVCESIDAAKVADARRE